MDDLRAADAAKPSHKGIRNGLRVKSGKLIGPDLESCKSAWTLAHKIRRAMEVADGFPLIMNVQADETSIPYRLKGSEPPPGGRSREGRLMIAGPVEVFGENSPGCAELRRIMDQSGPTLKAFLEEATTPGTWWQVRLIRVNLMLAGSGAASTIPSSGLRSRFRNSLNCTKEKVRGPAAGRQTLNVSFPSAKYGTI